MTDTQTNTEKPLLHDIVRTALKDIEINQATPNDSQIPAARFKQLQTEIKSDEASNMNLSLDLVYAAAKMHDSGLGAASEQMLTLARIILGEKSVSRAMDEALTRNGKAKHEVSANQQAANKPKAKGVGLRGNSKRK